MTSTTKDTGEMDGNEQTGNSIEVHINLNGQPFVETLDQTDEELINKSTREQEQPQEPSSPNSLNSEICLHTIPNMEVHILQESPQCSDGEDLTATSNLDNQEVCHSTSTVIVTDAISICSANLSGISQAVVFSSPVLSAICTCPPSDSIADIDADQQNTGLMIPKREPSGEMDDSCITSSNMTSCDTDMRASDAVDFVRVEMLAASSTDTKNLTTTPAEGIVVTANQASMCYLRQIFDGDQSVAQGQIPTIVHSVASDNLPELQQCKWQGCFQHFLSLEDLVRHVNEYHIRTDKNSEFCCYWQGCARNGKGFNARYKMLIHMRTHTGEKPHKCLHENCGKSFSRLENLKIHQRCHTGERPYACPYDGCTKRYSNSSDRFKHTRTHYEQKPYHCRIEGCEKRYTDPSSLRKHLRTHHGHEDINIEDQE